MRVALVCIAKNEENYIKEWIDYNKKLWFDDIFIYQNDWVYNVEYDNVHYDTWNGLLKQTACYNKFVQLYHDKYDWAAFFDVDEFLVLKKHNNIKEFIEDYKEYNAIGINWRLFGNNGHDKVIDDNYNVLERFTKRENNRNPNIKSIIKLKKDITMLVHHPFDIPMVDTNYNVFRSGIWNFKGTTDVAQLNHYFCKTREEFEKKCERGRADGVATQFRKMSEYEASLASVRI